MEDHVAAEHLQVIRTLMERSALYRHTLAPIMLYLGTVGAAAGGAGIALHVEGTRAFVAWWLGAALLAVAGAFAIARRQALREGEPFWSPPARRVTQALAPPLVAGALFSLATLVAGGPVRWLFVVPNALFYGCAVHAAGFFMPRGMKLFGWALILVSGAAAFFFRYVDGASDVRLDHLFMTTLFGLSHLAYGVYLSATESKRTA